MSTSLAVVAWRSDSKPACSAASRKPKAEAGTISQNEFAKPKARALA